MSDHEKDELLRQIQAYLDQLRKPLSSEEKANGWSVDCQNRIGKLLESHIDNLQKDENLPSINLIYGLDSFGVTKGEMFEEGAKVSRKIWEYSERSQ
ncbi:MAG: hypothetical protein MUP90_18540 [Gammaproteobacteria bacterium]|nr:hypothetical protein [Gammaproteobacteria bacterium]